MNRTIEESFFSRRFWNLQIKKARDKSKVAKTKKTRDKWDRIANIFRDRGMYLNTEK